MKMIVGTEFQLKLTIWYFLDQICSKRVFPLSQELRLSRIKTPQS